MKFKIVVSVKRRTTSYNTQSEARPQHLHLRYPIISLKSCPSVAVRGPNDPLTMDTPDWCKTSDGSIATIMRRPRVPMTSPHLAGCRMHKTNQGRSKVICIKLFGFITHRQITCLAVKPYVVKHVDAASRRLHLSILSNYNCVRLGSSLHFVVNEPMDFKFDLLKESYQADHGLSIL